MCASDACCRAETTCRSNLQRSSRRFRQIISSPDFEAFFGPAQPHPSGGRQNIFGGEDELRVAPKGVDKTHKCVSTVDFPYSKIVLLMFDGRDIDILKCRSFAVVYRYVMVSGEGPGTTILMLTRDGSRL